MTTRRFDPLRDLLNLQEKMNRLFEDSLAATRSDPAAPVSAWTPPADVYETAEGFVVLMDLPGLRPEDVDIHVDGERLAVRGERRPSETTRLSPSSPMRMAVTPRRAAAGVAWFRAASFTSSRRRRDPAIFR